MRPVPLTVMLWRMYEARFWVAAMPQPALGIGGALTPLPASPPSGTPPSPGGLASVVVPPEPPVATLPPVPPVAPPVPPLSLPPDPDPDPPEPATVPTAPLPPVPPADPASLPVQAA